SLRLPVFAAFGEVSQSVNAGPLRFNARAKSWAATDVSLKMGKPLVEPPRILPETVDRRLYTIIHGLPHSPVGDRYVAIVSDLGEGLGWVGAGIALAWMGGSKGRRAGLATSIAALGTTYLVQRMIKPVFRRQRGAGRRHPHHGRVISLRPRGLLVRRRDRAGRLLPEGLTTGFRSGDRRRPVARAPGPPLPKRCSRRKPHRHRDRHADGLDG